MKRFIKYITGSFLAVIILILLLFGYTHTSGFNKYLNKKIIQWVNTNTNLNLSIEKIEGDIYKRITLLNVTSLKNDTLVISVPMIYVKYDWRSLLKRKISVDSLIISEPSVYAVRYSDSTWNLQFMFKMNRTDRLKMSPDPLNVTVEANFIAIQNGKAVINSVVNYIPEEVTGIRLICGGNYRQDKQEFELYNMSFETRTPYLKAHSTRFKYRGDSSGIHINDFRFISTGSMITGTLFYNQNDSLYAYILAKNLDKDELMAFIPELHLLRSPEMRARINSGSRSSDFWIEVLDENQSLKAETTFPPLLAIMNGSERTLPFHSQLLISQFIPEQWIVLPETKTVSNGTLELEGIDLLELHSGFRFNAELNNLIYDGKPIDRLSIQASYKRNKLTAKLDIFSMKLDAGIMAEVNNIYSVPEYSLLSEIRYLDPSLFTEDLEGTFLRADLQVSGRYFDKPGPLAKGRLELREGSVNHVPLQSGLIYWDLENRMLRLDSLYLTLEGGSLKGKGEYNISSNKFVSSLHTEWDSTALIRESLDLPWDFGFLKADAKLSGKPDDIMFSGVADVRGFKAQSIMLRNIRPSFEGRIKDKALVGNVYVQGYDMNAFSFKTDSIFAHASLSKDSLSAGILAFINDSTVARWDGQIILGDSIQISTDSMRLNTAYSRYFVESDLKPVILKRNNIYIPGLRIRDRLNNAFELKIMGNLSDKGENDFRFIAENLDIQRFNMLLPLEDSITGLFNAELNISGRLENLVAKGLISAVKPGFGNFSVTEASGQLDYSEKLLRADLLIPDFGRGAFVTSTIPLYYHRDSAGFFIQAVDGFSAEVRIDSLPLDKIFKPGQSSDLDIKGFLNSEIQVTGSIKNPLFYGSINLHELNIVDYKHGITLEGINTGINLAGNKIHIDNFNIDQKSGYLNLQGEIEFDSSLINGRIRDASLLVNAKRFALTSKAGFELKMDADVFLRSGSGNPEFGGELRIVQSNINLDKLARSRGLEEDNEDIPLLVQASYGQEVIPTGEILDTLIEKELSKGENKFLENITGRLKVVIPHNTWLRNDQMNLELNGEFDIIKADSILEIFGEIDISRGYYIIYGKKLSIEEAKLVFKGGEKIDPELQLNGELKFRSQDRSARNLEVNVSGQLMEPEIKFFLDEVSITETEAMYILIFGMTADEMEQAGQGSMVTSLGAGQLSKMITSQLNRTLGSTLNLDYIEVSSADNWQSASFVVGTYITKDLFVTFQRGFGESESDEITPSEVSLEYQLNRLLHMRLKSGTSKNSGLDAILKFEEKKKNRKHNK